MTDPTTPQNQPYPAQPQAQWTYAAQPPQNTFAIIALIGGIVGFFAGPLFAIAGIVFGHIALKQIRQTGERGREMAIAGLIIGYVSAGLWILGILLYIGFLVVMFGIAGVAGTSGSWY